jgi:type IV secretory pathway VirB4 component
LDPAELAAEILKTPRGNPLYFSPNDSRLEALHWLVVGATGSGKSFFTGLVLKRMIEGGENLSVLFLDHNRSFKRLVRGMGGEYLELSTTTSKREDVIDPVIALAEPGVVSGIELSDLDLDAKRDAVRCIFSHLESLLKSRDTTHPVYLVLDECWHFLRDEPALVQRAFREFRKLNGAVIAITQSLSDFVTSQTGQTIFQNAPVRILLRQGEDLGGFRGALSLNDVELDRLRLLRQSKGEWAECLIKTPYLSRLGRLHPTAAEHELLRTDNLREEAIRENRAKRSSPGEALCQ